MILEVNVDEGDDNERVTLDTSIDLTLNNLLSSSNVNIVLRLNKEWVYSNSTVDPPYMHPPYMHTLRICTPSLIPKLGS